MVHAGLSKEAGKPDNSHLHLVFSERCERRGGAGGGAVVPASGAGERGPGVRGREEERAHEAGVVAGGDAAGVGGGMNLAFGRAGVADRVTPESHATQLARAREAGEAASEERLLLNPPSEHIGPAAKHDGRIGRRGRRS